MILFKFFSYLNSDLKSLNSLCIPDDSYNNLKGLINAILGNPIGAGPQFFRGENTDHSDLSDTKNGVLKL